MIISDLNYLEVANVEVVGGYGGYRFNYDKKVDVDYDVKVDIYKEIDAKADIKGNIATTDVVAESYGYDSLAEVESYSYTDPISSAAFGSSTSVSD